MIDSEDLKKMMVIDGEDLQKRMVIDGEDLQKMVMIDSEDLQHSTLNGQIIIEDRQIDKYIAWID